jgi:hypothetical protein
MFFGGRREGRQLVTALRQTIFHPTHRRFGWLFASAGNLSLIRLIGGSGWRENSRHQKTAAS